MTNELKEAIHELADSMCFCDTGEHEEGDDRVIWEPLEHLAEDEVHEMVDDFADSIERFIKNNKQTILNFYKEQDDQINTRTT